MANAALFVLGGKKLDAEAEKEIKDKLEGKRLTVALSSNDVDESKGLKDRASVEEKVIQALCKAAPSLLLAKKLDFRRSITAVGGMKLLVKTENERPYPCSLQLDAPPSGKAAPGVFRMDDLIRCEFDTMMSSRVLWIEVGYSVLHPNAAKVIQNCNAILAGLGKEVAQRVTGLVTGTVVKLNDGLASTGSKAMDWDAGDKLVEQLNRDIQRQIDSIYKESEARLGAKEGKTVLGGIKVDVVARFDKFKLHNNLDFPGGSPPLVDGKALKHLVKHASLAAKNLKDMAAVAPLVTAFEAEHTKLCKEAAAKAKKQEADSSPEALAKTIGPDLEKPCKNLVVELTRATKGVEAAAGHLVDLVKEVKAIASKHASGKPDAPDARNAHAKQAKHLDSCRKAATNLQKAIKDCASQLDKVVALLEKNGPLLTDDDLRQIGKVAGKDVLRSLAEAEAKLESTCKKVANELKD